MLRRQVRLRREYLYRKSLEGQQYDDYAKRRAVRAALESGRPLPTELQNVATDLHDADQFADALHDAPVHVSHDDEYAFAGSRPPKVVVTTSRDPSTRLGQFAKELRLLWPGAQRLNRGNLVVPELVATCRANEVTDVVVVHETRGEPDGIIVSHLPFGPTAYFNLKNVVMRHDIKDTDIGTVSEAVPHLIFENFETKVGARTRNILKFMFPVPKEDSKRVMTFFNNSDCISFRHHVFEKPSKFCKKEDIKLTEVGPRFEMQLYQIKLGTMDQQEAENEWVLRPYMNSAKKEKSAWVVARNWVIYSFKMRIMSCRSAAAVKPNPIALISTEPRMMAMVRGCTAPHSRWSRLTSSDEYISGGKA
mmetsp:Transcript_6972/g.17085  ORF Transcript_6972/g.17085 Transcript_6972/m.17085 type:complete len:363 (-) Transcript_6972:716-1804(-)